MTQEGVLKACIYFLMKEQFHLQDELAKRLTKQIVDFIAERGGRGGSAEVLEHFQSQIGPTQASLFRHILKSVAKLERRSGVKEWALRSEFAELASFQ